MVSDFADCTHPRKNRPEKSLLKPKPKKGGRNNQGITCVRFRGGGHKQRYRQIDFKRKRDGVEATVIQVEYDPNRSARIALIEYPKDETHAFSRTYILAPDGLKAGDKVISGDTDAVEPKPGNCMPLWKVPSGATVHNIELVPGKGGQICRSAGCSAVLGAREKEWAQLTLPSGEVRRVSSKCRARVARFVARPVAAPFSVPVRRSGHSSPFQAVKFVVCRANAGQPSAASRTPNT